MLWSTKWNWKKKWKGREWRKDGMNLVQRLIWISWDQDSQSDNAVHCVTVSHDSTKKWDLRLWDISKIIHTLKQKPERSAINCIGKRIRICFWRTASRQTCQGFQQLSHPRVETPLQLTLDSLRSVSVLSRHGKYCKYCKYCIYLDAIKSIKHN